MESNDLNVSGKAFFVLPSKTHEKNITFSNMVANQVLCIIAPEEDVDFAEDFWNNDRNMSIDGHYILPKGCRMQIIWKEYEEGKFRWKKYK